MSKAQPGIPDSEARGSRLLDDATVDSGIYLLDMRGIIVGWSSASGNGTAAVDIVGQHFGVLFTPEDRELGVPQRALTLARQSGRHVSEGWRVQPDGTRFRALAVLAAIRGDDGKITGFTKVVRDLSANRVAEVPLRDSDRQFRLLVAGVTDYALYMLDPDGIIASWNIGAQHIKGYMADEVVGRHFSTFYTPADRAAGVPERALRIAGQTGKYEAEGWRVRKDGSLFWAGVVIDAIHDERGAPIGFAKITRDLSERRAAQIALQKAQEQLFQSQKIEALGKLTGGVAHDFNNLLMIVSGHTQIIKRRLTEDARTMRSIEAIELATKRGESLTRQLLSFARRQSLKPSAVDLKQHIEDCRAMLANSIPGNINLVVCDLSDVWPVIVDAGELDLALVNIIVNARDAMPEGGHITISAENVHLQAGAIEELDGDFVALSVDDTGTGIPEDVLPQIFNPFFSTKAFGKGTGLGLSQVHGFAHQSNGTVRVSSELGHGTRMTIYLPRSTVLPAAAGPDHPPVEGRTGGLILLVEDNREVAKVNAALLEQLGYRVTAVDSADEAVRRLERGEQFDLVFSDIVMTGQRDGLALARLVRARHPGLPMLLATGYSDVAAAALSEFSILRKPFQLAALGQMVGRLIAEAHRRTAEGKRAD